VKLLFDQNLSHKLIGLLGDIFPESQHVRLLGLDRAGDRLVWEFAKNHEYTIVSLDADFAELAALYGYPPKVIWLRCGNQSTHVVYERIRSNVESIRAFGVDSEASCLEVY